MIVELKRSVQVSIRNGRFGVARAATKLSQFLGLRYQTAADKHAGGLGEFRL